MSKVQYLRLIGRLYPDNRLKLRPGYLTDNFAGPPEDPQSSLVARLYDEEDKLLLRYGVPTNPYCAVGKNLPELGVRAKVPFPQITRSIRFYRDDALVHEIKVRKGKPEVKLTWKPRKNLNRKQRIAWRGGHPEGQPLQYFLRYTRNDGKSWQRAGWRTEATEQEIDFAQLPGGEQCRIAVVATDGVNTVMVESESFSVPIKPCVAMIFAPADGASFGAEEKVLLRGQGFYLEENQAETERLIWTSSIDGELGKGATLFVSALSPGHHRITLIAGTGKRAGEATTSVHFGKGIEQNE